MKPEKKIKLTANETLLLLSTKNQHHKNYKKIDFEKNKEVSILNDYPYVADAFQKIVSIPESVIILSNVNQHMLKLLKKISNNMFQRVLEDLNYYNFDENETTRQAIFKLAYGYLQAVQVNEIDEKKNIIPLIILDEEHIS